MWFIDRFGKLQIEIDSVWFGSIWLVLMLSTSHQLSNSTTLHSSQTDNLVRIAFRIFLFYFLENICLENIKYKIQTFF